MGSANLNAGEISTPGTMPEYAKGQIIFTRFGSGFAQVAVVDDVVGGLLEVRKFRQSTGAFGPTTRVPKHDARPLAESELKTELVKAASKRLKQEAVKAAKERKR